MLRISTSSRFQKRVLPLLWVGVLTAFAAGAALTMDSAGDALFVVLPIALAGFGVVTIQRLNRGLVDEVWDAGDYLLVKNDVVEERIPLSSIINVNAVGGKPSRVSLRLAEAGQLGDEIAFTTDAGSRFNPTTKNPVAEDLIVRAHRARGGR